jgi:HD-like signal output (HDOD) protein
MNQSLKDRIRNCTTLPSLPAAALSVLQLTENDSTGMDELAKIISVDAALSARILRAINSSFYGLEQKVTSINQAVVLLGLHAVKTLVLGFSLVSNLTTQKRGFNHLTYWRRSMYSATASRVIAGRVLPSRADDCFVGALLMDLGALVLDQVLGAQYSAVYERAKTHSDLLILETHALGMTHAEAGAILAEHWKLPEVLRMVIEHHHGPQNVEDFVSRKVCEIVALAGRCSDVFVTDNPAESIASVRRAFLEQYQVREIECDALLCDVGQKTAELAPLFEVKVNASVNYEAIVAKASERLLELSLAEQAEGAAQVNRRKAARIRRDGNILLMPCRQGMLGQPVQVRLKDLSSGGIGIVHVQPIEKGSQFVIQLPQPGGTTKSLLYTVVRCDPAPSGGGPYSIGAELACVLKADGTGPKADINRAPTTPRARVLK